MRPWPALCCILALAAPTAAAEADPTNGRSIAEAVCTSCHFVSPTQDVWPIYGFDLPTFDEIAARPDLTAPGLTALLKGDHAAWEDADGMPIVGLTDDEVRDVVAYVMSRRPTARRGKETSR